MGWWKVQGTEDIIGDGPLDILGSAVAEVVAEYEAMHHRKPKKAEWEAVLGAEEEEARAFDNGVQVEISHD